MHEIPSLPLQLSHSAPPTDANSHTIPHPSVRRVPFDKTLLLAKQNT